MTDQRKVLVDEPTPEAWHTLKVTVYEPWPGAETEPEGWPRQFVSVEDALGIAAERDRYRRALAQISDRWNEAAQWEDWRPACGEMTKTAREALGRTHAAT